MEINGNEKTLFSSVTKKRLCFMMNISEVKLSFKLLNERDILIKRDSYFYQKNLRNIYHEQDLYLDIQ